MPVTIGTYGATGSTGWTVVTPSDGTQTSGFTTNVIYVSSSGSDINSSIYGTLSHPVKTLAFAIGQAGSANLIGTHGVGLRPGKPDWILLKKGDVFANDTLQYYPGYGPNSQEPAVISCYDPSFLDANSIAIPNPSGSSLAPPTVQPSSGVNAIQCIGGTLTSGGNNLCIMGIDFYAKTRDPSVGGFSTTAADGIILNNPTTFLLIEDCNIRFFVDNLIIENNHGSRDSGVIIRRNRITDAYPSSVGAKAQGAYLQTIDSPIVEENLFDANGGNATIGANFLCHNYYIQVDCTDVTHRGNIVSNEFYGPQLRCSTQCYDNTWINTRYCTQIMSETNSGYTSNYFNNVCTETGEMSGIGSDLFQTTSNYDAVMTNLGTFQAYSNIFCHTTVPPAAVWNVDPSSQNTHFHDNILYDLASGTSWILVNGSILTVTVTANGTNGTYTNVALTGAGGSGAKCTYTVTGGALTSFAITGPTFLPGQTDSSLGGSNYTNGGTVTTPAGLTATITSISANNDQTNNQVYLPAGNYSDPGRTISSYAGSLGLTPTTAAFIAAARANRKTNWSASLTAPQFNTYIRAGFGIGGSTYTLSEGSGSFGLSGQSVGFSRSTSTKIHFRRLKS